MVGPRSKFTLGQVLAGLVLGAACFWIVHSLVTNSGADSVRAGSSDFGMTAVTCDTTSTVARANGSIVNTSGHRQAFELVVLFRSATQDVLGTAKATTARLGLNEVARYSAVLHVHPPAGMICDLEDVYLSPK